MRHLRYALVALTMSMLGAACAAGVTSRGSSGGDGGEGGEGGEGGGTTTTSASTGGGGESMDAGPPVNTDCKVAEDCAGFNGLCTVGQCVNGLCQKASANEYGSCDDGLFCTDDDICQGGVCVGGAQKFCPSLDTCHIGLCDEALKTCKNVAGNEGAQCDDMNPCTYTGVCNSGVCGSGPMIDCSVFNSQCTVGTCDPVDGCKPVAVNNGVACNDNQFCTINDKCTNGQCAGAPNTCAAPGDVCMIGACNEATDTCVAVPGNDGAACDDMNLCTGGETCAAGICVGGQPTNDGVLCDDQDGCTGGTTCAAGNCDNPQSQIGQCLDNDMCCPAGCVNDNDCLYWASGVQQNVPAATLVGWTQCWSGTYDQYQPTIASILQQCDKSKLLLACRPVGAGSFTLAAMAPRVDVLYDCGSQTNCTKQSNGVGWYYSDSYSWGFAPGGLPVNRSSCDYNDGSQQLVDQRMCWHSGGGTINGGYRCGNNFLNGDPSWERVVFEAD